MKALLSCVLTLLAVALLADTSSAASLDGPILRGYIGTIWHGFGLLCMFCGGYMLRALD